MSSDDWTPERIRQLILLWDEGVTTAQIGRRIGLSKNAVIGKVHRLGLVPRVIMPDGAADLRPIPHGRRYGAVLADPPWLWEARSAKGEGRSAQRHYRCLDFAALVDFAAAIGLPERLCAPDCGLVMWATSPMLPQALALLDAWRFRYAAIGAWGKEGGFGTGYWYRGAAEFWLLGLRGRPPVRSRREVNFIHAPAAAHSVKPDALHGQVERMFAGPWLELFARRRRPGWDGYGDALGGFVAAEDKP